MKPLLTIAIAFLLLVSCTLPDADPPPPDTPVSSDPAELPNQQPGSLFLPPQPGDEKLERGQVFLDSTNVLLLESFPVQINLHLTGSLPTPCHQARFSIEPPGEDNLIRVDLYSLVNPDQICIQVLQEFEVTLPLGPLPSGHYTLLINGETAAEFDI